MHWRSLVKISEINADTKLPVFLVNWNNIGNTLDIPTLLNKFSFDEFSDFGLNIRKNIRITSASWLLMWPKSRLDR